MDHQNRRNLEVEENTGNTRHAVHDVLACWAVLRDALRQIPFEVGGAVLM